MTAEPGVLEPRIPPAPPTPPPKVPPRPPAKAGGVKPPPVPRPGPKPPGARILHRSRPPLVPPGKPPGIPPRRRNPPPPGAAETAARAAEAPGRRRSHRRNGAAVRRGRRGDGGEQRRGQGGAESEDRYQADGHSGHPAQPRESEDGQGTEGSGHRDDEAEPGEPGRSAIQQHDAPDGGDHQGPREGRSTHPRGAPLPQRHGAHADQGAQRWRQGDRVVGVDDALRQADGQPDAGQAATPEQEGGPFVVGALGPPREKQHHGAQEEGPGEQPGHHVAELGVEETGETGGAPHAARLGRAPHVSGLVPGQSAESVVAEDEIEDAVVL